MLPIQAPHGAFEIVTSVGLGFPGVQLATKYDGSPVLKANGYFMAGLAMHHSAEPDTLVIRVRASERQLMIDDAPGTYYLTAYYSGHPVVLVRLARVDRSALYDLLSMSRRLTLEKTSRSPMIRSSTGL